MEEIKYNEEYDWVKKYEESFIKNLSQNDLKDLQISLYDKLFELSTSKIQEIVLTEPEKFKNTLNNFAENIDCLGFDENGKYNLCIYINGYTSPCGIEFIKKYKNLSLTNKIDPKHLDKLNKIILNYNHPKTIEPTTMSNHEKIKKIYNLTNDEFWDLHKQATEKNISLYPYIIKKCEDKLPLIYGLKNYTEVENFFPISTELSFKIIENPLAEDITIKDLNSNEEPLQNMIMEYENSLIKDTSLEEAKELIEKDNTPTPKLQKQGTR